MKQLWLIPPPPVRVRERPPDAPAIALVKHGPDGFGIRATFATLEDAHAYAKAHNVHHKRRVFRSRVGELHHIVFGGALNRLRQDYVLWDHDLGIPRLVRYHHPCKVCSKKRWSMADGLPLAEGVPDRPPAIGCIGRCHRCAMRFTHK